MSGLNEEILAERNPDAGDRRNERREFFRTALGAAAVTAAGAAAVSIGTIATAATVTDSDSFNYYLNIEYLLAQFYGNAANGVGLDASQLTGAGTAGAATGARQVTFTDPNVAAIAREIASEKAAHVAFLRTSAGADVVAQPAIDLGTTPTGAFSTAMRAASIVGTGASFDPYASDENFLLAAFLLEDVAVTAYKGTLTGITLAANVELIAGLIGTTAYHAATIRTLLYAKGATNASLRTNADAISNARDLLDGVPGDDDQGISPATVNNLQVSNITPAAADGTAYGRSTGAVLNILYLNSASVSKGGFYPAGLNGTVVASAAN